MLRQLAPEATHPATVVAAAAVVAEEEMQALVTAPHVYGPQTLFRIPQVPLHWMSQLLPAQPWAHLLVTEPQQKPSCLGWRNYNK